MSERHVDLFAVIIVANKYQFPHPPFSTGENRTRFYFSCFSRLCTLWRYVRVSEAPFYIHHGGVKGAGGTLMGRGRRGFTSGFSFLFLTKLGCFLDQKPLLVVSPLPLASAAGMSSFGLVVSVQMCVGLRSMLGLALSAPMVGGCPHSEAS